MTREEQIQELAEENYPEDAILRSAFILGAHLADATMLNKACDWLDGFLDDSSLIEYQVSEDEKKREIKSFVKAMEGTT